MKALLLLALALVSCRPDDPEPPKIQHYYDLDFRCVATDYPIAIRATMGDSLWRDTIYAPMDTTIPHWPGAQKITLQGFAYTDSNVRLKVAIGYDYWNGVATLYPPKPIAYTEVVLPD